MKNARPAKPPVPIRSWYYHNEKHEGPWPIVDKIVPGEAKISSCDDRLAFDRHQHRDIQVTGYDGISDNGQEIFNFLEQEDRNNVLLSPV